MKEPIGLTNHKLAVLKMQSTTFCKVISTASSGGGQRTGYTGRTIKPSGDKPITMHSSNKENSDQQSHALRPRQQFSDAELDKMRKDKVCFKCKAPWTPAHRMECPNRSLRVLTVINGLDVEELDANNNEEDQAQHLDQELCTLSFNYFLGINSPRTTKIRGIIQNKEVVIMLDSGASHNFISPEVDDKLHLKVSVDSSLEVLLGNGVSVKALGVCRSLDF